MTTRYKMIMSYDGHLFHGFQIQPNARTVQGEIEKGLMKMTKGQRVIVHGSGRTDAGVHGIGQVIHFDYPGRVIEAPKMLMALNSLMPLDIVFTDCEIVDENFHVQYSAKAKWYRYRISTDRFVNPFKRFYTGSCPFPLDIAKMQQALPDLLGEHDFTSFAASGGQIIDKVRTIYYVKLTEDPDNHEIIFDIIGSGFLYNMVRIIVGTLLEIGRGVRPADDFPRIIAKKDRQEVRETAPASGLYLYKVFYEELPANLRMDLK